MTIFLGLILGFIVLVFAGLALVILVVMIFGKSPEVCPACGVKQLKFTIFVQDPERGRAGPVYFCCANCDARFKKMAHGFEAVTPEEWARNSVKRG